jgi:hypothetical protein
LECLSDASFLGTLLVLPANVRLDWKVIARYKHSSLFDLIVSNEGKKFYNIDTSKNGKPNVKISIVTDNTVLTLANRGDMTQTEINLSVLHHPRWPGNALSGNTN